MLVLKPHSRSPKLAGPARRRTRMQRGRSGRRRGAHVRHQRQGKGTSCSRWLDCCMASAVHACAVGIKTGRRKARRR